MNYCTVFLADGNRCSQLCKENNVRFCQGHYDLMYQEIYYSLRNLNYRSGDFRNESEYVQGDRLANVNLTDRLANVNLTDRFEKKDCDICFQENILCICPGCCRHNNAICKNCFVRMVTKDRSLVNLELLNSVIDCPFCRQRFKIHNFLIVYRELLGVKK